jgi:hypothetical protein
MRCDRVYDVKGAKGAQGGMSHGLCIPCSSAAEAVAMGDDEEGR